jgi:hypothetical protein
MPAGIEHIRHDLGGSESQAVRLAQSPQDQAPKLALPEQLHAAGDALVGDGVDLNRGIEQPQGGVEST